MWRFDRLACQRCGRQEPGLTLTLCGQLSCPTCRRFGDDGAPRGTLQRLFRIRPRRAADGRTVYFERFDS